MHCLGGTDSGCCGCRRYGNLNMSLIVHLGLKEFVFVLDGVHKRLKPYGHANYCAKFPHLESLSSISQAKVPSISS